MEINMVITQNIVEERLRMFLSTVKENNLNNLKCIHISISKIDKEIKIKLVNELVNNLFRDIERNTFFLHDGDIIVFSPQITLEKYEYVNKSLAVFFSFMDMKSYMDIYEIRKDWSLLANIADEKLIKYNEYILSLIHI